MHSSTLSACPFFVALLCGGALLAASPEGAWAYRQTKTCLTDEERDPGATTNLPTCAPGQVGWPVRWIERTVPYSIYRGGHEETFPNDNGEVAPLMVRTVRDGVEAWNEEDCSDFEFVYEGLTDTSRHLPEDGVNVITWIDDGWASSSATIALATTTMTVTGELVDADVEVNVKAHRFSISDTPAPGAIDLRNTIAHEAGHMLGLDEAPGVESTMYFTAAKEEVKKRSLHPDDIAGLCVIYPVGVPAARYDDDLPDDTEPPEERGCCATIRPTKTGGHEMILGLFAALALIGVRRRHAR